MTEAASTPAPAPATSAPPAPPKHTPPEGMPPATSRPPTWAEVFYKVGSEGTRRGLRFGVSYMIFKLQLAGKLTPEAAIALTACALGVESAIVAWKEKRLPVAAGLAALPLLLCGAGELLGDGSFMTLGGYVSVMTVPMASWLNRWRA